MAMRGGVRARGRVGGRGLLLTCSLAHVLTCAASAQTLDVAEALRRQRFEARAAEIVAEIGEAVPVRPPAPVGETPRYWALYEAVVEARRLRSDSLARARADSLARVVDLPPLVWRSTPADAQGAFLERWREAFWVAINAPAGLDTLSTLELRGRLNTLFGAPTRNAAAAEQEGYAGSDFVQFEYWLVANDSIPVLVLDVDGPFGRGLLVAGSEAHRRLLPAIKADLGTRLRASGPPTPYADYYQSADRRQWYRVGYDGAAYFTREVRAPRWARRPRTGQKWVIYR